MVWAGTRGAGETAGVRERTSGKLMVGDAQGPRRPKAGCNRRGTETDLRGLDGPTDALGAAVPRPTASVWLSNTNSSGRRAAERLDHGRFGARSKRHRDRPSSIVHRHGGGRPLPDAIDPIAPR